MKRIILLIGIIIVIIFNLFIVGYAIVDGDSMKPNLHNKQVLIYNKLTDNYKRFDIVILNVNNNYYIKRIIGLPYETVEYKKNELFINNVRVVENYDRGITENIFLEKIPSEKYFVLGDNRGHSYDSRDFGFVDKSDIKGKLIFKLF